MADINQIIGAANLAQALILAGVATWNQIAAALRGAGQTEDELNAVLRSIKDDAVRRKAMADADAAGVE